MIQPDPIACQIADLFSKRNIKKKYPVTVRSDNPAFKRSGNSFDFKNIREYQVNDDLKKIDWKLYGRTERYYIKEFFEEETLPIYIAVDRSASINLFASKSSMQRFIVSICYMLLKLNFTITILSFDTNIKATLKNLKGVEKLAEISKFIEKISFEGKTDILKSLKNIIMEFRPSILLVFSDFFDSPTSINKINLFKKLFFFHFFTPINTIFNTFGDYEVEDEEIKKIILVPFDNMAADELNKKQSMFLEALSEKGKKSLNKHYFRFTSETIDENLKEVYWHFLELLYG